MPHALHTYRHLGISLLMLVYLTSTIQVPVLEVVHLVSHAQEIWQGAISHHAYQEHDDSHQHTHLALWSETDKNPTPDEPFLNLSDLDKKNQYLEDAPLLSFTDPYLNTAVFGSIFEYKSHYQDVDLPPPRNVYC